MDDEINEIWGALVHSKEGDIYTIKNEDYNFSIKPGTSITIGFQAEVKDTLDIPQIFKMPIGHMEIPQDDYLVSVAKVGDYETRIDIKNVSQDSICGWSIEFDTDLKINNNTGGEIRHIYDKINIQSYDYNSEIAPNETVSINLYNDKNCNEDVIDNICLYKYEIIELSQYRHIKFNSCIDINTTNKVVSEDINHTSLEDGEVISIEIEAVTEIDMGNNFDYVGCMVFKHNDKIVTEKVEGEMTLYNEGVKGELRGYVEEMPIVATVNYAFQNTQPYVFLAVNSVNSGEDYYKIYGQKQVGNDSITNNFLEMNNQENQGISKPISVSNNGVDEAEKSGVYSRANTDYDVLPRACTYEAFTYNGSNYYLGAVSLFSPIKTKANCTYTVRAKVNSHDGNAQYFFQKIYKMPGMITYFDSDASLIISTKSKKVDFVKASPDTTSWWDASIGLQIPFGKYLSMNLFSVTVPASITKTLSSINGSPYENKCKWRFKEHYDADIVNNDAVATKKGYAGYVKLVNEKNSKHTYTVVAKGNIYYKMNTKLANGEYESSYISEVETSKVITNYANN